MSFSKAIFQLKSLRIQMLALSFAGMLAACASLGDEPAPVSEAKPVSPSEPVFLASDILGASPNRLDALLGAPALTRLEGKGEFRRYRLSSCTLIVILYPDETGARNVDHAEAAALKSGDAKPDLDLCLAAG